MLVPFLRRALWPSLAACLFASAPASAQLRAEGPPVRLLADGAAAVQPVWSPDGAQIAFTRDGYVGLWAMDADGDNVRQLSEEPAAGFGFAWSPDGRAIAARVARLDGVRRTDAIKQFELTGEEETLIDYAASTPSVPLWLDAYRVGVVRAGELDVRTTSEAPRLVALTGETVVGAGPDGIRVADLETGNLRDVHPLGEGALLNAVVSPDGQRVAFEAMGGGLHVMDRDGSNRIELGTGHRPAWSPDGRWVVFMTTEDDGHVFTAADLVAARTDGSARVELTTTPDRLEMNPSWSPDGRAIAFDDATDGALYLLPITE
ncbi:MAG: hypothetical protein Rubg2KO_36060 [Rubricoccaceae bacterium]